MTAIDCVKNNLDQLKKRAALMSKYYFHRVSQENGEKANKEDYQIEIECIGPGVVMTKPFRCHCHFLSTNF